MSKSKFNYKVYNGKSFKKIFENSRIYTLALLFSIGISAGAICTGKNIIDKDKISLIINSFIISKSGQGISELFINSLLTNILFFAVNLFLSFSLIGFSIIMWIPFLKGLGIGAVCGHLYSTLGLKGFGYSALTIFPGAIVSVFALISACNNGFDYSRNAYSKAIFGKGQFEKGETKYFLIRQFIYMIVCSISALIDTLFSFVFSRFFEL